MFAQLVSKIFSLCGHDPPTSQTDRQADGETDVQTDDMRSQDRLRRFKDIDSLVVYFLAHPV